MLRSLLSAVGLSLVVSSSACACSSTSTSTPASPATGTSARGVRIATLRPPSPLPTRDRQLLVYELTVTPPAGASSVSISRLTVEGAGLTTTDLSGDALAANLFVRGADNRPIRPAPPSIAAGQTALVYLLHELAPTATPPERLTATATLSVDGAADTARLDVPVATTKPVVLGPPLRGKGWVTFNGIANTSIHRRAVPPLPELHVPERYAIDFISSDDGGALATDPKDLKSWFCYGAELLAVGDGTVVKTSDGAADQPLGQGLEPSTITADNIAGNMILLELDGGRGYVLYAHIAPGAVKVKVGEHVTKGAVVGLLGNTGNSTAPHLHIHVADRPDALASEGVPFVFERFTYTGKADIAPFDADEDRINRPERRADAVSNAKPAENEIVDF